MGKNSLDQQIEAVEKRLEALTAKQREDSTGLRDELAAILDKIWEAGKALYRQRGNQMGGDPAVGEVPGSLEDRMCGAAEGCPVEIIHVE